MRKLLQFVLGVTMGGVFALAAASQASPSSLGLDGVNDYIASQSTVNIATNQITLEAWVYPAQSSGGEYKIAGFHTAPYRDVYLSLQSGGVWFVIMDPTGTAHKLRKMGLGINQWYHLSGTYDGSTMRLYIDGAEVTTFDFVENRSFVAGLQLSGPLYLSVEGFSQSGQYFPGLMDEVRIWDYARSAAQISASKNSLLQGNEGGLVLYYPFDDGNLTLTTDATGHGYDGQLIGGPGYSSNVPFAPPEVSWSISASAGAGGSISPSTNVASGGSPTFTITPASGYHIADVLVDGGSVGAVGSYTFSNVTTSHTIAASFAINTYTFSAAPTISVVAGTGVAGYSGDGGLATQAQLSAPAERLDVAVDGSGNIYIADVGNRRVRRVDGATGIITTVAGTGASGYSGDGGPATQATLNTSSFPFMGVEVDAAGNLFIADTGNNRIRRVDVVTGIITTVAGSGNQGLSGDGGLAVNASLNEPADVDVDVSGNLYIADLRNHRIRRVDKAAGVISTVAGNSVSETDWGYSGDGGLATAAKMVDPWAVSVDPQGSIFVPNDISHRVRRIDGTSGIITTVAGFGVNSTNLANPRSVDTDGSGSLFVTDYSNSRVIRVDIGSGTMSTIVNLSRPSGLSWRNGSLYIADAGNHRILRANFSSPSPITASTSVGGTISPAGTISVSYGARQTFTIVAEPGYHIADVVVDGVSVGAVSAYTFLNVTMPHAIYARFAIDTYTITASAGVGGGISPLGVTTVNYGDNQGFIITADAGHHIADVLVDGSSVGVLGSHAFSNIMANHTLVATFAANPSIAINDVSVNEGNGGTTNAVFTVSLSSASIQLVEVAYRTTDGTARAGGDYLAQNNSLIFVPGEISKSVTIAVNGDVLFELDEAFSVDLNTPTNARITDNQGIGTVLNDDPNNHPPVAHDGSLSADEDILVNGTLSAGDEDGDALTYRVVTDPTQGTVSITDASTGAYSYTPNANVSGSDLFTFQVSDGALLSNVARVSVTVIATNDAPVVGPIPEQSVDEGQTLEFTVSATDDGGPAGLTYAALDLPEGSSFDPETQAFSWTPSYTQAWNYLVTFTVTDDGVPALSVEQPVQITVNNVPVPTTTSLASVPNPSVFGNAVVFTATVVSELVGVSTPSGWVTFSEETIGPDLGTVSLDLETVELDGTGQASFSTDALSVGIHNITAAYYNDIKQQTEAAQKKGHQQAYLEFESSTSEVLAQEVKRPNQPPVADAGPDQTVECAGARTNVTLNSTGSFDLDPEDVLSYSWSGGDVEIPVADRTKVSPTLALAKGSHTLTLTVADGRGGTDTDEIVVNVVDTTPPTIALNGANPLLVELGTAYSDPGVTANDACCGSPQVTIPGSVDANTEGSHTLTYTATDLSGNSASAQRIVQVVVTPNSYGLIATHSMHLRQNARVLSGFAGVVNRGQAPFLAGKVELVVGTNVQTGPGVRLSAPRVRVRKGANVAGKLVYDELVSVDRRATIADREDVGPSYFPLFQGSGLPTFQTGTPGSQNVEVRQKGSATLSAGAYDEVRVRQKGTLTFTGGTYQLGDLEVGQQGKVLFLAPTTLLIRGQLHLDQKSSFGPGVGLSAAQILVYVEGRNGRLGNNQDDDEGDDEEDDTEGRNLRKSPRAAKIGVQATFQGNLYAANGTLHLRQGAMAVGAFIARDIIVGVQAQVVAQSGWNTPGVSYQPAPLAAAKLVGEQGEAEAQLSQTGLLANYPNPFNPSTTVPYVLAETVPVKLSVYNVLGQQIRVLVDQLQVPGAYTVSWDGLDATGQQVAGGVYFYRLAAGEQHAVGRMLLLR